MDEALRRLVRERSGLACEYCRFPMSLIAQPFAIDHSIARQHGGETAPDNLANICQHCNLHKGPNIAGLDPVTGQLTRLFHPRRDRWEGQFTLIGSEVIGTTAVGRVTVAVLAMNDEPSQAVRSLLIADGLFPPPASEG